MPVAGRGFPRCPGNAPAGWPLPKRFCTEDTSKNISCFKWPCNLFCALVKTGLPAIRDKVMRRLAVLGMWVIVFGASWASAQTSFRFVAWGGTRTDNGEGVNTAVFSSVSNQVNGLSPQPLFTLFQGDLCYTWDSVCTSTSSTGWKYAINNGSPGNGLFNITFPLEGNHDTNAASWDTYWNGHARATVTAIGGSSFNFYSAQSENRTYSFDYGNSHFCMMDNQGGAASTLSSGQISWLDSDIAAAEARGVTHTFIMTHGPIWSVNQESDTPSSSLIAVINKHVSISAAIVGHEHVLSYAHVDSSRIPGLTHPC